MQDLTLLHDGPSQGRLRWGPARPRRQVAGQRLFTLALVAIVASLVLVPVVVMILAAFRPPGTLPLERGGAYSTAAFSRVAEGDGLGQVLLNTVVFAAGSVTAALPIALALAFLTERTDLPFRRVVYVLMFIPMSIPVFATALGWILLLAPRSGLLNVAANAVLGREASDGLLDIFGMPGLIFVQALSIVPSMWLLLIGVLRNINPVFDEASATSGVGRLGTLRHITLPLIRPGIAAVVVYYAVVCVEVLELPLALGPNAGIEVLSTRIFFLVHPASSAPPDYAVAAVMGLVALVLGVAGITLYSYLIRQSSAYVVVTGKGYRSQRIALGRWRWAALGFVVGYLMLKVVLPLAVMLYASFLTYYQPPRLHGLPWTMNNFDVVFDYRFFGRFAVNSFQVSVAAAVVTMAIAALVSWSVVRYPSRSSGALNVLSFMPLAVPGVISALAFFFVFVGTSFFGSLAVMVVAFVSRYLAYGTRLMHAAQLQIHKELEEAAHTSSVRPWRSYLSINFPLLRPAFLNGMLWVLVHAARDFSVALLLASSGTLLVGNVIYGSFTGGDYPVAAAMILVLVAFNVVVVTAGRRWVTRDVDA